MIKLLSVWLHVQEEQCLVFFVKRTLANYGKKIDLKFPYDLIGPCKHS